MYERHCESVRQQIFMNDLGDNALCCKHENLISVSSPLVGTSNLLNQNNYQKLQKLTILSQQNSGLTMHINGRIGNIKLLILLVIGCNISCLHNSFKHLTSPIKMSFNIGESDIYVGDRKGHFSI